MSDKQFGVDEAQFVEMMYRHQQPALSIQRDMIKGLMTPIFWKRAKKHPPLVNFREAWKMQITYTEKVAEDAKKAGRLFILVFSQSIRNLSICQSSLVLSLLQE